MNKGRVNTKYEDKYIKSNRTFPTGNTVLLVIIVAVQIGLIIFGLTFQPKPQDVIHQYDVTVTPLENGSLDIEYHFVWEALDASEPLTWVEIGMANSNFTVYKGSMSGPVRSYAPQTEDGYVTLRINFDREYRGGEVVEFSFKINQKDMLCKSKHGYFYEFVPGWFNAIAVENYNFIWHGKDRDYLWQGSLHYGEYCKMSVQYGPNDFDGCPVVGHKPFDDSGASNSLESDRIAALVATLIIAAILIAPEVYIIDSYVSYNRGRGFLTGHGYHVHTYGRSNPYYVRARNKYHAAHSGRSGGRSGGCACACACACAGGGRAGCSQKDTFGIKGADHAGNETTDPADL